MKAHHKLIVLIRMAGLLLGATHAIFVAAAAAVNKQTITFLAISNKTYGVVPFAVNPTASSGLAVSLASLTSAVCTVSGNTVTLVAAGTRTIRPSPLTN